MLKPKWFVVMESGMLVEDCPDGSCYTMGLTVDDGCFVALRESPEGWQPASWIPLGVVKRMAELVRHCDLCNMDFVADERVATPDDVFYKVQSALGKTVCPKCINEARGQQP